MIFAGFGGMIIGLTLGALLYPIEWLLPVLLPLTILGNLYIFIRHFRHIDRRLVLKKILPFMGTGLLIGFFVFSVLRGDLLQMLFGLLVIIIAGREMVIQFRRRQPQRPLPKWTAAIVIFCAGLVHGIYASGGPLLVYAVNKLDLPKTIFRSTLAVVWLIMNIVLNASYLMTGKIDLGTLKYSAALLPFLALGILLGERLHHNIPERGFKLVVYGLLIFSGTVITLK